MGTKLGPEPSAPASTGLSPFITGTVWPWGWHTEPHGHGIQTLTGMTPKALRWWHPESLGDSTQTSMGMAPRHPQEWYPRPCDGGGNQNPMEMAPKALKFGTQNPLGMAPKALWWQQSLMGKHPKTCDESAHSSMGTSPTALWGWHPESLGDSTQGSVAVANSSMGMAPKAPWAWHPEPHGAVTQSPMGMSLKAPWGRYSEPCEMAPRAQWMGALGSELCPLMPFGTATDGAG